MSGTPTFKRSAWFGAMSEDPIDGELDQLETEVVSYGRESISFSESPVVMANVDQVSYVFKPDVIQGAQDAVLSALGIDASSIPDALANVGTEAAAMIPGFAFLALFNPVQMATTEPRDIAEALIRAPGFEGWPRMTFDQKEDLLGEVLVSQIGAMDESLYTLQQLLESDSFMEAVAGGPAVLMAVLNDFFSQINLFPTGSEQAYNKLAHAYVVYHMVGEAIRGAASAAGSEMEGFATFFDTYPELIEEIDTLWASGAIQSGLSLETGGAPSGSVVPQPPPDLFPIEEVAPAVSVGFARPATVLGVGYAALGLGATLKIF